MELDVILKLMQCFSGSTINQFGEFIAHDKGNACFNLKNCKTELDIQCKVLEWFSREACKSRPYKQEKKNDEYHKFMLSGINKYLGTDFKHENMMEIYCELGNAINHNLTIEFVQSNFDFSVFRKKV